MMNNIWQYFCFLVLSLALNSVALASTETPELILNTIVVEGSTAFKQSDFAPLITPYLNRSVKYEELLELAEKLTKLYEESGFTTSQVVLLEQEINDGRLVYSAIEGQITQIKIDGLTHYQDSYIRSRIEAAVTTPFSPSQLGDALLLLQQESGIEKIKGEILPSYIEAQNSLSIQVDELPQRWSLRTNINNYDNPQFGEVGISTSLSNVNLLGWGDTIDLEYRLTKESSLNQRMVRYRLPLNIQNGTLQILYRDNEARVVESTLADIGLVTDSSTLSLSFNQPIIAKVNSNFSLGIDLDIRKSESFIFNTIPFPVFGESNRINLSVLRLSQLYLERSSTNSFSVRSQLSMGLDIFGASPVSELINTNFISWQFQTQYAFRINSNLFFVARYQSQLSLDSLPSIEQFTLGGVGSVRGYRQNLLATDNGMQLTLEAPLTVWSNPQSKSIVFIPFFDFGTGWNNSLPTFYPNSLASLGLSLQIDNLPFQNTNIRIDYGLKLINVPTLTDNSLQDIGLNFSIDANWKF